MKDRNVLVKKDGHSRKWLSGIPTLEKSSGGYPRQKPSGMTHLFHNGLTGRGFTLIELLVVVLIMGILAAVALPQYQKAVEKSRATQAMAVVKSLAQAGNLYYLSNGRYPTSLDQLEVKIPWSGTTKGYTGGGASAALSNETWSVQIWKGTQGQSNIYITRLTGPWKGAGFSWAFKRMTGDTVPTQKLLCTERIRSGFVFDTNKWGSGGYCQKLFGGTAVGTHDHRFYTLPF